MKDKQAKPAIEGTGNRPWFNRVTGTTTKKRDRNAGINPCTKENRNSGPFSEIASGYTYPLATIFIFPK